MSENELHQAEGVAKITNEPPAVVTLPESDESGYFQYDANGDLIRDQRTGQAIPRSLPAPFDYLPCRLNKRARKKKGRPATKFQIAPKPMLVPPLKDSTNYGTHSENLEVLKKKLFIDLIPSDNKEGKKSGDAWVPPDFPAPSTPANQTDKATERASTLLKVQMELWSLIRPKYYFPKQEAETPEGATHGKEMARAGCYAFKIVLVDETANGKSLVIQTFVEGKFDTDCKSTVGTSIMKKELVLPGSDAKVRFIMWNLAKQNQYRRVRQTYYQNAEAGIVIFDATRRETFGAVEHWVTEVRQGSGKPGLPIILIGTNAGLSGLGVSHEEGTMLGRKLALLYIEDTGTQADLINGIFEQLARILVKGFSTE